MYWPNTLEVLNALTSYAYGFQAFARVGNYFLRPRPGYEIQKLFEKMYESSESVDISRKNALTVCVEKTKFYTKFFIVINFIGFHLPVIDSLINKIFFRANVFAIFSFLPFLDSSSENGFWINFTLQLFLMSAAFFGFSTYDATFIFFSMQSIAIVDLFKLKLGELEAFILNSKVENRRKIKKTLVEIIQFQELFNRYVDMLRAFTIVPSFAAISINTLGICVCLLTAVTRTNFGAIGIIISFFFQIFIPCTMGTLIMIQVSNSN